MAPHVDTDASLVADAGRVVAVSDAFLDLTGYCADDVLHRPVDAFFRSTLRATAQNVDFQTLEQPVNCYVFTASLMAREVTLRVRHLRPTLAEYYVQEVPNSRLEERFFLVNQFFYSANVASVLFAWPGLQVLRANQRYLDYAGQPSDALPSVFGKPLTQRMERRVREVSGRFQPPAAQLDYARTLQLFGVPALDGGQSYWDEIWTPIWECGGIRCVLGVFSDATERVRLRIQAQEKDALIRLQREQLQAIVDNMSDGLMLVDRSGEVKLLNQAARSLFYDPDSFHRMGDTLRHTRYFDLEGSPLEPQDTVAALVLQGKAIQHRGLRCERPDRTMYMSESGSPIYDEEGNVSAAIVCSRDVSAQMERNKMALDEQRHLLEIEQLQRENLQRAMEMKDQFFSLVTHELKTPLAVIDLAVQSIEHAVSSHPDPRLGVYLGSIRQSNYRQLRLVNNLLDMARLSSGHIRVHRQNVDLVALCRGIVDSVRIFTEKKGIALLFHPDSESLAVSTDAEKIERMLLNLLSNAIKFSPDGGPIAVALSCDGGWVSLTVQDQGIGIPPDKQELIFERFGQVDSSLSRSAEGTGIGLALVRQFAQALGGSVSVVSSLGRGSAFTLRLPALPPQRDAGCAVGDGDFSQAATIEFADVFD